MTGLAHTFADLLQRAADPDRLRWEPLRPGVAFHALYGQPGQGPAAALLRFLPHPSRDVPERPDRSLGRGEATAARDGLADDLLLGRRQRRAAALVEELGQIVPIRGHIGFNVRAGDRPGHVCDEVVATSGTGAHVAEPADDTLHCCRRLVRRVSGLLERLRPSGALIRDPDLRRLLPVASRLLASRLGLPGACGADRRGAVPATLPSRAAPLAIVHRDFTRQVVVTDIAATVSDRVEELRIRRAPLLEVPL